MPLQDSDPRAGQVQATEPGEIVGTAHDRPEDADAARASEALVDALREAHELVRSGEVGKTLTDVLWFVALDPAKPTAPAVAVVGDRILAVGELVELNALAGTQPYTVNTTFANQVVVPGFIAQHDHPLLAALTMTSTIIAIEDWVLPQGTSKAAKSRDDYLKRLAEANASLKDPNAVLLTWGYHQYFHGELKKADLDKISATRPIIVWHRSAHEFYLGLVVNACRLLARRDARTRHLGVAGNGVHQPRRAEARSPRSSPREEPPQLADDQRVVHGDRGDRARGSAAAPPVGARRGLNGRAGRIPPGHEGATRCLAR